MKPSKPLYQITKTSRDLEAILSGDWHKILRRVKNKIVGRALARIGFWKFLWQ
jgi:hypothetical protein